MQVRKKTDVFNLMDTNGRRKDLINAYSIYLNILQSLFNNDDTSWDRFPKSLNQYKFYQAAIKASPEVFKKHPKFDEFQKFLDQHNDAKMAFNNKDFKHLSVLCKQYANWSLSKKIDTPIESRARHYTSNLVKIGFTDKQRQLSPVGIAYLNGHKLQKDEFEELLPIKDGNLIFLRQLMKLKIYTKQYNASYNPMMMTFYLLLNLDRINQSDLLNTVVFLNPYVSVNPERVLNAIKFNSTDLYENYLDYTQTDGYKAISKINGTIDKKTFFQYFHNKKTKQYADIYYNFYIALKTGNITQLFNLYSEHSTTIDSAFGFGKHTFKWPRGKKSLQKFIEDNKSNSLLTTPHLNTTIYERYLASTRAVSVAEYSDTFRRLLKASGIVSFKNGIAELMYKNLWQELFTNNDLKKHIFENYNKEQAKQAKIDDTSLTASFMSNITITKIAHIDNVEPIIANIQQSLHINSANEVKKQLLSQKDKQFKSFVQSTFPKEKVLQILTLFESRSNDSKIKELVDTDASVPTIYEYIVGLAWYYISDDSYNLYDSFNLSMNADFRPETHAAGGEGDIVIRYTNDILMLEVTLMNKQAQKRGEWEPVLRHTTNLTIDSEPTKVRTLFIADELDPNTINIWRAVASVPMHSSQNTKANLVANNITIMPIKNEELCKFLKNDISSKTLIHEISKSFSQLKQDFDKMWRNKILNKVLS